MEFYKEFWPAIGKDFLEMTTETFIAGELPDSLRKAVMALIFKKDDREIISNYRPISLTNSDYKIVAFCLAERMHRVIKKLISNDQSAYVRGRFIGFNYRIVQDIIDYCEEYNTPNAILFLDFEKAFDSVSWYFMLSTLRKFNFGPNFIRWIEILYKNPVFVIKNNGWFSREVQMQRGVRQGCPVSALLFILVTEILAIQLRATKSIKGFQLNGSKETRLTQHADDMALIVSDHASLSSAIAIVARFGALSGLQLNMGKTKGMNIGGFNPIGCTHKISWTRKPIKYLGIYTGPNHHECDSKNWDENLEKLQLLLDSWHNRSLTLFGKIAVVKALGVSKLNYISNVCALPDDIVKRTNKIIYGFLWKAHDRIKRNTLIGKIEDGGLGMIDIESSFIAAKAIWVVKLLTSSERWTIIPKHLLMNIGITLPHLIKTQFEESQFPQVYKLNRFYRQAVVSFFRCKDKISLKTLNASEFFAQTLWANNLFMLKNKCLLYLHWQKSGFNHVKDMYDINGNFIEAAYVKAKLVKTNNWLIEYMCIRKILLKKAREYDCRNARYVNVINDSIVKMGGVRMNVETTTRKMLYTILVGKKFERNYMERFWSRTLYENDVSINWKYVYLNKVHSITNRKLAEFQYKILCNLLPCRKQLYQWKLSPTSLCEVCGMTEDVKHLLFDCDRVKLLWVRISSLLKLNIRWKHLVVGFPYKEYNIQLKKLNGTLTIIAYSIYKSKIVSGLEGVRYCDVDIVKDLKKELFRNICLCKYIKVEYLCQRLISKILSDL